MNLKFIKENFSYDRDTGRIYKFKDGDKRLVIHNDDFVVLCVGDKRLKIKYDRLAYALAFSHVPDKDEVVFHKDLDEDNCKINNLALLTREQHRDIIEAIKNLSGDLYLAPHPRDVFSYVLHYKQGGRMKKEVVGDVVIARRKLLQKQLYFSKLIGRYVVSV